MASAATLPQAAGQSFDNLFTLWAAGGFVLRNAIAAFSTLALDIFPESQPVGHPLANWAVVIASLSRQQTSPFSAPMEFLTAAVDYVYRICWLASKPTAFAPAISGAQQDALLAAYNASF
jgi:hypothetical protein